MLEQSQPNHIRLAIEHSSNNKISTPSGTIGESSPCFESPSLDHTWHIHLRSGKVLSKMHQQPKQKNSSKQSENTIGMPSSCKTTLVAMILLPNPPTSNEPITTPTIVVMPNETPTIVNTSFIRQQIDIGIHDIIYQLSGKLAEIVKPMIQNEIQQTKELEVRRMTNGNNSPSSFPTNIRC